MGQGADRRNGPGFRRGWLTLVGLLALCPASASAADDLLELSLEDLMNVEVTSVSKKAESKQQAAAAVTVITAEDIRRGGFTSVPEALRIVPGLQVARIDASRWAISIRGYREEFSNKLLVMIDGRSIYTPVFGGVVWAEQTFALEDVERIEVIRGPGGTIWGANAVNGVINIISKKAKDTQGTQATIFAGAPESGLSARYGGSVGDHTQYRFTTKAGKTQDYDIHRKQDGDDEWNQLRLGTRADTKLSERTETTLLADYFDNDYQNAAGVRNPAPPFQVTSFDKRNGKSRGGDVVAQLRHQFEGGSRVSAAAYYDIVDRHVTHGEKSQTGDLQIQHELSVAHGLNVVYGAEYRYWNTQTQPPAAGTLGYDPNGVDFHLGDAFVQLELPLLDERVKLIGGTKLGGNSWAGFTYQPSGRVVVTPVEGHTVWGAVSRAVRTPTFTDRDLTGQFLGVVNLRGDRGIRQEEVLAYELGYRFYSLDWLTAEVSLFWSEYDDVAILVFKPSAGGFGFENAGQTSIRGGEIELSFLPVSWWRVTTSYSILDQYERNPNSILPGTVPLEKRDPFQQFVIRSLIDLPSNFELDAAVYFVDGLEGVTPTLRKDNVRAYARFDLRLGWKPTDWLDVSLVGQNLGDTRHAEFYDVQGNQSTQVPRSGYAKLTVHF